jgi:hypothetical protein
MIQLESLNKILRYPALVNIIDNRGIDFRECLIPLRVCEKYICFIFSRIFVMRLSSLVSLLSLHLGDKSLLLSFEWTSSGPE